MAPRAQTLNRLSSERLNELGRVGQFLLDQVGVERINIVSRFPIGEQIDYINKVKVSCSPLKAAAYSILSAKAILQCDLSEKEIDLVVESSLAPLVLQHSHPSGPVRLSDESKYKYFPVKMHPGARNKTNIWFTEVYKDLSSFREVKIEADKLADYFLGLTNDQATSVLLMGVGIKKYYNKPVSLALRMAHDPKGCKQLTTVIKSLGIASHVKAAVVCEGQVLQGKGIGELNLEEEARKRTTNAPVNLYTRQELTDAIRVVLQGELDMERYQYEDPDVTWSRRWLWCVNGGHAAQLSRSEPEWSLPVPGRVHRKVAAECWTTNPITNWSGTTYASASNKWEPGKSRLILSCDTACYAAFEHIMQGVERAWRNDRVLLNPGIGGVTGWVNKVRGLRGSVNVMLDYDDFNSQHTHESMEILFEELIKVIKYPADLGDKLVRSFRKTRIFANGIDCGYSKGTLMSGHRCTTFINSVLNAAYIIAANPKLWERIDSLHTGDDVVARFSSVRDAAELTESMASHNVRLNKLKQSIGTVGSEFLRCAIGPHFAIGYLPRAVIECVNGNWVSEDPLEGEEAIASLVGCVRTMINRSLEPKIGDLVVRSASRYLAVKRSYMPQLLAGTIALGEGPVYSTNTGTWRGSIVIRDENPEKYGEVAALYPDNATTDYLSKHVSPIERLGMELAGLSVKTAMKGASYAKSLHGLADNVKRSNPRLVIGKSRTLYGSVKSTELAKAGTVKGALERYPILHLLRHRLDTRVVRQLLTGLGVLYTRSTVKAVAWGEQPEGKIIRGFVPYSDARSFCRHHNTGGIVYVDYQIYM